MAHVRLERDRSFRRRSAVVSIRLSHCRKGIERSQMQYLPGRRRLYYAVEIDEMRKLLCTVLLRLVHDEYTTARKACVLSKVRCEMLDAL